MKTDPHGPADTRVMGIVHDALRRDLTRTRDALTTTPYPQGRRRTAIADHVRWMMSFLHDHHSGEDAGLWPLVRERNPGAAELLDAMDADHARIAPAIEVVEAAAVRYGADDSDASRTGLLGALDELSEVLLPHLRREESETMPIVSKSLTEAEWSRWDQQYNVKPKSLLQLADEGHWILDGIDPVGYDLVVNLVPPVPRFILLRGFARRYRRRAALRWGA